MIRPEQTSPTLATNPINQRPTLGLERLPGRCSNGFAANQHDELCQCAESEWSIFLAAIRAATRDDGTIHQSDVRPKIRGRVAPKHIGTLYRRAKSEGLIADTGEREQSSDVAGRNSDKLDRIYRSATQSARAAS